MRKISQKEFFNLLINGSSAKVGAPVYSGKVEVTDSLVKDLAEKAENVEWRKVTHVQSNALKFENDSWMFFSKPKNCDSRNAYLHEIDRKVYISLVDHRPAYENQFGTPIKEQTMMLVYELQK